MNRQPPSNLRAEESVLGAMLLSRTAIAAVIEALDPDHFHSPANGHVYAAIAGLYSVNQPADVVTVAAELERSGLLADIGGAEKLLDLQGSTPAISNAEHYASIVIEHWTLRQVIIKSNEMLAAAYSGTSAKKVIEQGEKDLFELGHRGRSGITERPIKELLMQNLEAMELAAERGDEMVGIPTGLIDLDQMLSGLQSKFYVLAGRPGMGKSALATQIAANVAATGNQVLMYSLEMPGYEQSQRMLNAEALVDSTRTLNGNLEEPEWNRISHAVGRLADRPIHVDDDPYVTIDDMRSRIRRAISQRGPLGMIVIDYIQLMQMAEQHPSRVAEVTAIARGTKLLQREFDCCVMGLAQAKRDVDDRIDKRPQLGDLSDSSELEKSADVVMYVYRDEVYDDQSPDRGVAEVITRKHRGGPLGTAKFAFRGQYTRFDNMARSMPGGPPPAAVPNAGEDGSPQYDNYVDTDR